MLSSWYVFRHPYWHILCMSYVICHQWHMKLWQYMSYVHFEIVMILVSKESYSSVKEENNALSQFLCNLEMLFWIKYSAKWAKICFGCHPICLENGIRQERKLDDIHTRNRPIKSLKSRICTNLGQFKTLSFSTANLERWK